MTARDSGTEDSAPGCLYVVATPIGNLEDLTLRALRILREVRLIAAEDTRTTRKLLAHYDIHTPLTSYHAHSSPGKAQAIVQRLLQGEDVAVVSDAGTPGVSDPGALLVRAAIEGGARVVPIPGPSALVAALCAAGLDPARFLFEGFLPRGAGDRRAALSRLRDLPHTLVFYEAPGRVAGTLGALLEVLGDRPAVVAREVTKKFEEFARGSLAELAARLSESPPRGECVLLVAGSAGPPPDAGPDPEERLAGLLRGGMTARDAARTVASETGLPRRELYAAAVCLKGEAGPEGPREED